MNRIDQLIDKKQKIDNAGGQDKIQEQHDSGKMTARERIEYLFDSGSFIEMDAFVEHRCKNFNMASIKIPADGVVTGYGTVEGKLVYAYSQDITTTGGSVGEMHAKKICKVIDMALKMGAPVVGICDSKGARIQEGIDVLSGYGQIFNRNTKASGVIPQISVIMGSCTGSAINSPALSDFVFTTQDAQYGFEHFIEQDEKVCLDKVKMLLSYIPSNNLETPPEVSCEDDLNRTISEFDDLIADDISYDMKDVIIRIADNGEFFEVQEEYAQNIVIGFIKINGKTIGIVANQPQVLDGFIDINAAEKAARFISICDSYNIPLLNLVDVPGLLPDKERENSIIYGAKMIYAYSEATVPKVTLILRKAYGSAYIAMCSKDLGADVVYAWPSAEISIMSPQNAVNIIFKKEIEEAFNPQEEMQAKVKEFKDEIATPYIAASKAFVDDVIIPCESRQRIAVAFEMLGSKRDSALPKKHGNFPV